MVCHKEMYFWRKLGFSGLVCTSFLIMTSLLCQKEDCNKPYLRKRMKSAQIKFEGQQNFNFSHLIRTDESPKKGTINSQNRQQCDKSTLSLFGSMKTNSHIDNVISHPPEFDETIRSNPMLTIGGRYIPTKCKSKYNVAIIIPFRGREFQLKGLLAHMHPIWKRQGIQYTVYTATQAGNGVFNKGKLMNAGFLEAAKDGAYDCYVFHDVDLLLENDQCLYWCSDDKKKVIHLPYLMDKFGFRKLSYLPPCMSKRFRRGPIGYFGGVTMFTPQQFRDVNGFSNIYWGWGGEDDDALLRVKRKGYVITRDARCQYRMFKHDHDEGNRVNPIVGRLLNVVFERQDSEGLTSIKYSASKEKHPLYTNLTINVGIPSKAMLKIVSQPDEQRKCNGTALLNPEFW